MFAPCCFCYFYILAEKNQNENDKKWENNDKLSNSALQFITLLAQTHHTHHSTHWVGHHYVTILLSHFNHLYLAGLMPCVIVYIWKSKFVKSHFLKELSMLYMPSHCCAAPALIVMLICHSVPYRTTAPWSSIVVSHSVKINDSQNRLVHKISIKLLPIWMPKKGLNIHKIPHNQQENKQKQILDVTLRCNKEREIFYLAISCCMCIYISFWIVNIVCLVDAVVEIENFDLPHWMYWMVFFIFQQYVYSELECLTISFFFYCRQNVSVSMYLNILHSFDYLSQYFLFLIHV